MTRQKRTKLIRHLKYNRSVGADYLITDEDADEIIKALEQEPCEDCVSRNAIIKTLNETDRYIADELTLCDNNNKFPQNEVFIVDDVYEKIEQLLSVTPKPKTDVFDKIRAEIKALPKTYSFINIDTYVKENDVNKIIDKYKAESEE